MKRLVYIAKIWHFSMEGSNFIISIYSVHLRQHEQTSLPNTPWMCIMYDSEGKQAEKHYVYRHENRISKVVGSPADTMGRLNGLATESLMYCAKTLSTATDGRLELTWIDSTWAFRAYSLFSYLLY